MDINFHYFAVKSVALAAGLDDYSAQRIATFSQFIDDYDWYTYFIAGNIPKYIKDDKELDIIYDKTIGIINPVTTGLNAVISYPLYIVSRTQKFILSPFHFIPKNRHSIYEKTSPAVLNDGSLISDMLIKLKDDYQNHENHLNHNDTCMLMGMLLHTFADTYAHQLFSGYANIKNLVAVLDVTNNINNDDVTSAHVGTIDRDELKQVNADGNVEGKITHPIIGHLAALHTPDLTHLSFNMNYIDDQNTINTYGRSNTSTFVTACKHIYNYLIDIFQLENPLMKWSDVSSLLAKAFLFDSTKLLNGTNDISLLSSTGNAELCNHWKSVFNNFSYSYDEKQIKNNFYLSKKALKTEVMLDSGEKTGIYYTLSDDFYKYNYFADKILINLYGPRPRKFLS